jgi:hypothetical protein
MTDDRSPGRGFRAGKETPSWWWITSAAMVPKTATIITADQ